MLGQRQPVHRDPKWLAAVHEIDCCVQCGRWGIQAAHRNQGKAKGKKVDDCLTAALCLTCHDEIDNGKDLTREERRQRMNDAILATITELARRGLIGVK
ncbi:hypothetical protein DFO67_108165 [Modicisalibacter xianhensis]|uniref:DUF1364 family protein n=1 Tax=Modicisalibacter xianhensis TaxID=442341 RepID=A0A4R8FRC0_9GAMM|nr:hypothetical protein [Halomonas xianhensis]TDX29121.1 hypothetical protein DFO67_108165 [Halomonas xianhensis]